VVEREGLGNASFASTEILLCDQSLISTESRGAERKKAMDVIARVIAFVIA
jgi:hypothetical protein